MKKPVFAVLGVLLLAAVALRLGIAPDSTTPPSPPAAEAPAPTPRAAPAAAPALDVDLASSEPGVVKVWKSPTCGCCSHWMDHLEEAGYRVEGVDVSNLAQVKAQLGIPGQLHSCHTALIDGYLVEGHVPAADVDRLLEERPEVAGIAVPGMPIGSPGMEMGDEVQPYEVLAFTGDGSTTVWNRHGR